MKCRGAPRRHWTLNTLEYAWTLLQDALKAKYPDYTEQDSTFNEQDQRHVDFLTAAAQSKGFGLT